jgi:hypothetical protein
MFDEYLNWWRLQVLKVGWRCVEKTAASSVLSKAIVLIIASLQDLGIGNCVGSTLRKCGDSDAWQEGRNGKRGAAEVQRPIEAVLSLNRSAIREDLPFGARLWRPVP